MPFSLRLPRFLRFGRSRSRPPKSTADACDDGGVSSAGLDISQAFSRPTPGPSEQGVDAAPRVARLSVSGGSTDSLNRAPVDIAGQPSPASRPVAPTAPTLGLSSHDAVVPLDIQVAPPSDDTHSAQAQQYLAPPRSPYELAMSSQQPFHAETTTPPAGRDSPELSQQKGMFDRAQNFSIAGSTFIDVNVANNENTIASQFMKDLLERTIPGAASDSSARYPPPQCHPGTRLGVLERCLHFIANCTGEQKIRWVFGSAGVGKSAIMQSVADSPNLPVTCYVSVFFSINGRDDGTKAIITLCYQLAAKYGPYRHLIEREVARDPSLLQASMPVQFQKFIIQPFIQSPLLNSPERILIIIDGLDECNNSRTQQELLRLISDLCIKYPSSPLVWLIASRPEQHITSFFARPNVTPAYEKEEIQVDSDEGRADVERFLREKLEEIKGGSNSFDPHSKWVDDKDFWKLAKAAGGLFAYADTVIRYIDDPNITSPASQLLDVLKVIDNHPMTGIPREEHPMALLDALYARILSNVPVKVILHTRKLVLALASHWDRTLDADHGGSFVVLCNWLAMTPDEAYAAVNQLQALLRTPKRDQANLMRLESYHKSFIDYVSDSSRSYFFTDMHREAQQLDAKCAFRVLHEAPDGVDFRGGNYRFHYGTLRRGPGTGGKISLTWPVNGRDTDTRLDMYKLSIGVIVEGLANRDSTFTSESCLRLLITQFTFHHVELEMIVPPQVFDESRRHESMKWGILRDIPLKAVPYFPGLRNSIMLRFCRPARTVAPGAVWNPSCEHERKGEWEEGKDQVWLTVFRTDDCIICYQRFEHQFQSSQTHSPNHTVTVMFTSTGKSCVEFRFVDPDDGISEWQYWYWIEFSPEERKKLGSTV
ncbi:hypothetical protein AGABI2DRAFT_120032 [Agaricus bisporus var. bisporus H97]|uniref:hypothetical protein n=1 Tax=Agaricus bisporus var. bisporus (strain H97 / ATCC MYA-4626 / FGSC 10389) TaxID=936046 RepID=UPI00029F7ACF|nr:hypothetical protein AGABI2DRAFT_120032 [Agaricus bisporus var. bisporus H97]EKV45064.1 hypothetical protein AGABI2DRAFT_120032 [Agaricus bisporus var. bisporus H97]